MRYIYWPKRNQSFPLADLIDNLKNAEMDPDDTVVRIDVDQDPETKEIVGLKLQCTSTFRRETLIPIDMCVKGRAYRFAARNFQFGVFDGVDGFIGLRTKFGDPYLFTEYHHDRGAFGTVAYIRDASLDLPQEILPVEILGNEDAVSHRSIVFRGDEAAFSRRTADSWHFADTDEPCGPEVRPRAIPNLALYEWLEANAPKSDEPPTE